MQLARQFIRPFINTEYSADAIREIEVRLTEEIDYRHEREATNWFYENAAFPNVLIPKTYAGYSSGRVLATELLDGQHIQAWLDSNPSQEQRDRAAQTIYDYFMHCAFHLNRIHADPNPGNYLFRNDGQVALVDFGAIKVFRAEFCATILELWRAHIRRDTESIIDSYLKLGFAKGDRKKAMDVYEKTLKPFDEWLVFPYQFDVFDFSSHPEYCAQGMKVASKIFGLSEMDGFTPENIMFDRNFYGLFRIFTELKAHVRLKNQWIY
jgi:predicted unusual protein kinase regulating ubiquinone biosynthesis (AarF/ABC1/UbiB family)